MAGKGQRGRFARSHLLPELGEQCHDRQIRRGLDPQDAGRQRILKLLLLLGPLNLPGDLLGNNEIELLQAGKDLDATYMHQVDQNVRVNNDRRRKAVLQSLLAGDEYIGGPGIQ